MNNKSYIVATKRPWNIAVFKTIISKYPGKWHLITEKKELTLNNIKLIKPRYIFLPHWSDIVPRQITKAYECVCFHETDVPFGRGGSPIQNLIQRGYKQTKIAALRMTDKLDSGPIYFKKDLSLNGLAEEIFIRSSKIIATMISEIIRKEPEPYVQKGESVVFKRRTPEQSIVSKKLKNLEELFDFLRMLDAAEYPKAFFEREGLRYEFSRPALRTGAIEADVRITECKTRSKK